MPLEQKNPDGMATIIEADYLNFPVSPVLSSRALEFVKTLSCSVVLR